MTVYICVPWTGESVMMSYTFATGTVWIGASVLVTVYIFVTLTDESVVMKSYTCVT